MEDWDALELLWENAVEGRLGLKSREHPVMLAEPALAPKADRERWAELLFETFEAPGFFVSKQGILTWCVRAQVANPSRQDGAWKRDSVCGRKGREVWVNVRFWGGLGFDASAPR